MKPHVIEIDANQVFAKTGLNLRDSPLAEQCVALLLKHLLGCITPEFLVNTLADAAQANKHTGEASALEKPEKSLAIPSAIEANGSSIQKKKTVIRSPKGNKRKLAILVRLSEDEFRWIRSAFGRQAVAVARILLLGQSVPSRKVLSDTQQQEIAHGFHSHMIATEQTRAWIRRHSTPEVQPLLDAERETLNHLMRLCLSKFSK